MAPSHYGFFTVLLHFTDAKRQRETLAELRGRTMDGAASEDELRVALRATKSELIALQGTHAGTQKDLVNALSEAATMRDRAEAAASKAAVEVKAAWARTGAVERKLGLCEGELINVRSERQQTLGDRADAETKRAAWGKREAALTAEIEAWGVKLNAAVAEVDECKARQAVESEKALKNERDAEKTVGLIDAELKETREELARTEGMLGDAMSKTTDALQCAAQRAEQLKELEGRLAGAEKAVEAAAAGDRGDAERDAEGKRQAEAMKEAQKAIGDYVQAEKIARAARSAEQELRAGMEKMMRVEEATESALTCLSCMGLFKDPVTCVPCGHTVCRGCLGDPLVDGANPGVTPRCTPWCKECGKGFKLDSVVENTILNGLVGKATFRKQAVASLRNMAAQLRYACEGGGEG
jgi:hypothetical protein